MVGRNWGLRAHTHTYKYTSVYAYVPETSTSSTLITALHSLVAWIVSEMSIYSASPHPGVLGRSVIGALLVSVLLLKSILQPDNYTVDDALYLDDIIIHDA